MLAGSTLCAIFYELRCKFLRNPDSELAVQHVTDFRSTTPLAQTWQQSLRAVVAIILIGLFVLVGVRATAHHDPYIEDVLALQGRYDYGASLFAQNCAACHGEAGKGRVGPSLEDLHLHRSDSFIIRQVTSGNTLPMPQFQPDPQEMADLLSFLHTL